MCFRHEKCVLQTFVCCASSTRRERNCDLIGVRHVCSRYSGGHLPDILGLLVTICFERVLQSVLQAHFLHEAVWSTFRGVARPSRRGGFRAQGGCGAVGMTTRQYQTELKRWEVARCKLKRSEVARCKILEALEPSHPSSRNHYYYYIAPMLPHVNHPPPDETLKDRHV